MSTSPSMELKAKVDIFFSTILEKIDKPVYYETIRGHISHAPEDVRNYVKKNLKGEELLMYFKHRPNYYDVTWHKEVILKKKQTLAVQMPVIPPNMISNNENGEKTSCENENYIHKEREETQTPKSECKNDKLPHLDNGKCSVSHKCIINKKKSSLGTDKNSEPYDQNCEKIISQFVDCLRKTKRIHHTRIESRAYKIIKDLTHSNNTCGEVVDFFKHHNDIFCVDENGFIMLQNCPPTSTACFIPASGTSKEDASKSSQGHAQKKRVPKISASPKASQSATKPKDCSESSKQKIEKKSTGKVIDEKSAASKPDYSSAESKDFNESSEERNAEKGSKERSASASSSTISEDLSEVSQERIEEKSERKISETLDLPRPSCPASKNYLPPNEENNTVNVKEISAVSFFVDILRQQGPVYLENLRQMGASSPESAWCSKLKTGRFKKLLQSYPYLFVIKHSTEVALCNRYEGKLDHLRKKITSVGPGKLSTDDIFCSSSLHEDVKEMSVASSIADDKSKGSDNHCIEETKVVESLNEDECHKQSNNYISSYAPKSVLVGNYKSVVSVISKNSHPTIPLDTKTSDARDNVIDMCCTPENVQKVFPVCNETTDPTCNEITDDTNGSAVVSIRSENPGTLNNNLSGTHCSSENNDPILFPVCSKTTDENVDSVGKHAEFLVVWMAELLCFQVYEACKAANCAADYKAVLYFISEIRCYCLNFSQQSVPYTFLKGKLGQAPPDVSSYINQLYRGKQFGEFFREHDEFRALPESVELQPFPARKISRKSADTNELFSDFVGFRKLYYTRDFLRLFCAIHDTIKTLILFICNKVNVPLSRLSGKLGSLGSAEQDLLRSFEGQSSVQKLKLFLSHFDIIFNICEERVGIYKGCDALLSALQNHILICALHSLVSDGRNTIEKLTEAVCSSYPQILQHISDLENFITKNSSSFSVDVGVITSKDCGFTNPELLAEVLNLIKEGLQDRHYMFYTEILYVVKSHPQLLSQIITEMPIILIYSLKTDQTFILKEGKISLKSSLEKSLSSTVGDNSPTETRNIETSSPFTAGDKTGSDIAPVQSTNPVETKSIKDFIDMNLDAEIGSNVPDTKSKPKELRLIPEIGSLQNSICCMKVHPKITRTVCNQCDVEHLRSLSGNKLLVAVKHFKIESDTLSSSFPCTIKLDLFFLNISELHHEYPKLFFSCIGKPTKKWMMQNLICLIYEKFKRKYANLFCLPETTAADIHSEFLHFLRCLAVVKCKSLGERCKKTYHLPLEETHTTGKLNQHSEKNAEESTVNNNSSVFPKEDLQVNMEKLNQSFEGKKINQCVEDKKFSQPLEENVSAEILITCDNSEPGYQRKDVDVGFFSDSMGAEEQHLLGYPDTSVHLNETVQADNCKNNDFNFKKCTISDVTCEMPDKSPSDIALKFLSPHMDICYEAGKLTDQNASGTKSNISRSGKCNYDILSSITGDSPVTVVDSTTRSAHKEVHSAVNTTDGAHLISVIGQISLLAKDSSLAEITSMSSEHWVYFSKSVFTCVCAQHSFAKLKLGEKVNCFVPVPEPESRIWLAYSVAPICCQENSLGIIRTPPTEFNGNSRKPKTHRPIANDQDFTSSVASVESEPIQESSRHVPKSNNVLNPLSPELQTEKHSVRASFHSVLNNSGVPQCSNKVDNQDSHASVVAHSIGTAPVDRLSDINGEEDNLCVNHNITMNGSVMQDQMVGGELHFSGQHNTETESSVCQDTSYIAGTQHTCHDVGCQTISTGLVIMTDLYCE